MSLALLMNRLKSCLWLQIKKDYIIVNDYLQLFNYSRNAAPGDLFVRKYLEASCKVNKKKLLPFIFYFGFKSKTKPCG